MKSQDTKNAVLALLDGKPVPMAVTRPFGCSTKWLEKKHEVATDHEHWEKAPVTLEPIDAAGVAVLAKKPTGKHRLVHVWFTTCASWVQEFPGLMRVSRRMGLREFEPITLSTDLPEDLPKARAFLEKQHAALPSGLADSLKKEGRTTNNYLFKEPSMQALISALDPAWERPQPPHGAHCSRRQNPLPPHGCPHRGGTAGSGAESDDQQLSAGQMMRGGH